MAVTEVEIMANGVLQFAGAAVSAAPQLLFGQGREPAFDQIEPGSSGRGEVQVKAGVAQQPAFDRRRFVRAVVVED